MASCPLILLLILALLSLDCQSSSMNQQRASLASLIELVQLVSISLDRPSAYLSDLARALSVRPRRSRRLRRAQVDAKDRSPSRALLEMMNKLPTAGCRRWEQANLPKCVDRSTPPIGYWIRRPSTSGPQSGRPLTPTKPSLGALFLACPPERRLDGRMPIENFHHRLLLTKVYLGLCETTKT